MHKIRHSDQLEIYCYSPKPSGNTAIMLEVSLEALKPLVGKKGNKFRIYQSETSTTIISAQNVAQLCCQFEDDLRCEIYSGKPLKPYSVDWFDDFYECELADLEFFEKISKKLEHIFSN